jgi:hypothetical protein
MAGLRQNGSAAFLQKETKETKNFVSHPLKGGILKRLAEIDKTLLEHDSALRTIWTKLQPLLTPPPEPPRRRIGFQP